MTHDRDRLSLSCAHSPLGSPELPRLRTDFLDRLLEGRLHPAGRRGGRGTYVWSRLALDGFLRGLPPATIEPDRSGAPRFGEAHVEQQQEVKDVQKIVDLGKPGAAKRVAEREDGGHVVRGRVLDVTTGKQKEIWRARRR